MKKSATGGVRIAKLLTANREGWMRNAVILDCYNQRLFYDVFPTVTTRIDHCNHYWITQLVYEKVETYGNCTVDVDYGPCYILAKAGKLIDVDPFDYSWKTSMIVTKEKVTVRDGYGADRRILYQKTSDINPKELKK